MEVTGESAAVALSFKGEEEGTNNGTSGAA